MVSDTLLHLLILVSVSPPCELTYGKLICIVTRDNNLENAKTLAEMVDDRLARYYDLDDSGKKKVRRPPNKEC